MKKLKKISTTLMLLFAFTVVSILPGLQKVTPAKAATSVELNQSKLTLYVGKTYSLKVTGTTATVTWKSNKTSVATVTKAGKVTAKSAGSATITATVNSKKYTCKVTVKDATVVYGKVTAISGKKVTLALGTMNQPNGGTKPSGTPTAPSGTPAVPSGTPAAPSGTPAAPSGTPSNPSGTTGGAPDLLTLTGKSITITISDTSILSKESMQIPDKQSSSSSSSSSSTSSSGSMSSKTSSATLSDITVGSILKVTYTSSTTNVTSVVIMGGGGISQP